MKRLLSSLGSARGNGTSMITVFLSPRDQVSRTSKKLSEELGAASHIKSRVNRLSVISALNSTIQRLKLYPRVPENGLAIFCGTVHNKETNKDRKVTVAFEPLFPLSHSLYQCDNRFHAEALEAALLDARAGDRARHGFVVVDGSGVLLAALEGAAGAPRVLHRFSVDLPRKHGRGGQSALRFGRLREEARHNYVRRVAEAAQECFIDKKSSQPNVTGLILAGSAELKDDLAKSSLLDPRLAKRVVSTVDVAYGGKAGLREAIRRSAEVLNAVKMMKETTLIENFFDEVGLASDKVAFGAQDVLRALEMGAVETLIASEDLKLDRVIMKGDKVAFKKPVQEGAPEANGGSQDSSEVERTPLLDWIVEHYKEFGAKLQIVSGASGVGSQFEKGFGGLGAMLRYGVDFQAWSEDGEGGDVYPQEDEEDDGIEFEIEDYI